MKNSKQSLKVTEKVGPTYPAAARGDNLAEGVSHHEKGVKVDSMYGRNEAKQRPATGSDRCC